MKAKRPKRRRYCRPMALSDFFRDTAIMPEQVLRYRQPQGAGTRISAALIASALDDLDRAREMPEEFVYRYRKQMVLEWVNGAEAPIRFELACSVLGIDAEAARERILGKETWPWLIGTGLASPVSDCAISETWRPMGTRKRRHRLSTRRVMHSVPSA